MTLDPSIWVISIHALREEGDLVRGRRCTSVLYFYPRPPRGGRLVNGNHELPNYGFLSTPSARRATGITLLYALADKISIHALREEGDSCACAGLSGSQISIHALREEGDCANSLLDGILRHFYPRPPRGGRRFAKQAAYTRYVISIHALREEGDATIKNTRQKSGKFLSTPSARRATQIVQTSGQQGKFLSTPSARRATLKPEMLCASATFLSTPSARRATAAYRPGQAVH